MNFEYVEEILSNLPVDSFRLGVTDMLSLSSTDPYDVIDIGIQPIWRHLNDGDQQETVGLIPSEVMNNVRDYVRRIATITYENDISEVIKNKEVKRLWTLSGEELVEVSTEPFMEANFLIPMINGYNLRNKPAALLRFFVADNFYQYRDTPEQRWMVVTREEMRGDTGRFSFIPW